QGIILGEVEYTGYKKDDEWVSAQEVDNLEGVKKVEIEEADVDKKGDRYVIKDTNIDIEAQAHKMSKSRGNEVNPEKIIEMYGADSMRLYEMFMGPLEQVKPWNTKDVDGVYRFLGRIWRLIIDEQSGELRDEITEEEPGKKQLKALHQCIQKVTNDIEGL